MKKRLKKKIFSYTSYSYPGEDDKFLWKILEMHDRWRLYERLAIKEGLITVERSYLSVPKYVLDKAIEKEMYSEYLAEKGNVDNE